MKEKGAKDVAKVSVPDTAQSVGWRSDRALTLDELRPVCPPDAQLSHEVSVAGLYNCRWKITAPYCEKWYTKVYSDRTKMTSDKAAATVLRQAWTAYTQSTGIQCPWNLDAAL
eukprot:6491373-Amphidinium_carterae.1